MKITNRTAVPLALAALLPLRLHAAVMDKVAVKVNNEPIMMSEYAKTKEALTEQYQTAMPEFFRQKDAHEQIAKAALDKLIDEALLRQKAQALNIKVYDRELDNGIAEIKKRFSRGPDNAPLSEAAAAEAFNGELRKEGLTMEQFRERTKRSIMVRKLVEEKIRSKTEPPSENDVRAYFDKIKAAVEDDKSVFAGMDEESAQDLAAVAQRFKEFTSERIRVRHILVKTDPDAALTKKNAALKKIEGIKKELDDGGDFEDLAEKYSEDNESADKGGDLGYVIRGMLPEELDRTAFELTLGDVSKPVLSQFGYHLLRVDERRIATKLRYEQAKDDLEQLLTQAGFGRQLAAYLKELRKDARIQDFTGEGKEAAEK